MEQCLSAAALLPFPDENKAQTDSLLAAECAASHRKIVVLDDDPTGVQTVHGVSVYTDWSRQTLAQGFAERESLFFVLTNSRSFSREQTRAAHAEIIQNIAWAAAQSGKDYLVVSRGDSTLRGHYPLETQILREGMEQADGLPVDGEILCPYFAEGGRFTLGDVHYVRMGQTLTPAAQTEFAQDKTFGYTHSNLREYVQEKTNGAFPAHKAVSIALEDLRALRLDAVEQQLLQVCDFEKIIVNATDDYDVKVFCIALYRALAKGKRFCMRTAAAFVKALGNISARPLLSRAEMVHTACAAGGIVVVGSHTKKTTAQFAALTQLSCTQAVELNAALVLTPGALGAEAVRVASLCDALIAQGVTPVVYTTRTLLTFDGDTPEQALSRSVEISDAVQSVVVNLSQTPAFVVAKGGITSSDVGTKALKVRRAKVLGQIRPGIPVWETGPESRFPGIPYIIFPGNVGEESTLREAVEVLTKGEVQ